MTNTAKAADSDPMDVVEISTGTTPETWDLAQMHPPGPQAPALDPFAEEKTDPEDLDAGALWPRSPGGPRDEDRVGPLSVQMGTDEPSEEAEPATDPVTVRADQATPSGPGPDKPPTLGRKR